MKKVLCIIILISLLVLASCEALEYKSNIVLAQITKKEYIKEKKTYDEDGNCTTTPAKYYVTLNFDGVTGRFDKKSLYNSCEEDQWIEVEYIEGRNEEGILRYKTIKLIKGE